MDNAIQTAQDLATATARLDAYKDWFTILIGILSIAVVIALAACGTLIKNHVQTGIMKGAVEAQKTLDKNNEHEAKLLQLEDALGQITKTLEAVRIQSNDLDINVGDIASRISELNSSLSANIAQSYVTMGAPPDTWDSIWILKPGTYSWIQTARLSWQPHDAPFAATNVLLSVSRDNFNAGFKTCELYFFGGEGRLVKYIGAEVDKTGYWARVATATPSPVEFELPLMAGGVSDCSRYYKNQIGEVKIRFSITYPSKDIGQGETIGLLPEGFRPKVSIVFPIAVKCNVSLSDVMAATAELNTLGNIKYCGPALGANCTLVGSVPPFLSKL